MPVPRAPQVTLADHAQSRLESIVRAHSTPQALSFRCQLILRAAAPDCPSNLRVAKELNCDRHMWVVGEVAILNTASVAFRIRRAQVGPGAFPPHNVWM